MLIGIDQPVEQFPVLGNGITAEMDFGALPAFRIGQRTVDVHPDTLCPVHGIGVPLHEGLEITAHAPAPAPGKLPVGAPRPFRRGMCRHHDAVEIVLLVFEQRIEEVRSGKRRVDRVVHDAAGVSGADRRHPAE